jgi:signal transduction histidine kinase
MNKKSTKSILLVEDNPGDARLLREMFNEQSSLDTELTHVESMSEAERHLAEHAVDIILLDLGLPDAQGLEAVRRAHAAAPRVPLVVLTGLDDESLATQALQEGAQDYLIKGQIETRGLLRDLRYATERKRLDRLKDEFVSSVSHELRTPLTSISVSLALLMGKPAGTLPDSAVRLLAIAHTNSQRLVRLVNDILDIETMESGQVAFNFRRVEVRSLIEQAIEANRAFAAGCGVRIRLEGAFAVGEVRADSDRLAQVVTNLLSNAIKFSPADSEVVVAIEKGPDVVRISVRDHGPGISLDFKPRIFERFAQADATNARQKGGTGLGLSIVKQMVDRLGGDVGFADAPGGGTIFHVELPCWEHVSSMAIDLDAQPNAFRILLCEDEPDAAVALCEQLRQIGFATDVAYTASDAITLAAATQYRAILVDLLLPDGDGISLILRLRELPQYRDTPIIVVSADPGRGRDDLRSSKLNVLDWLKKPMDIDRLLRVLTKPVVHGTNRRPRIFHVDEANVVAQALSEISVSSMKETLRAEG